jgi:hypothetical protein
MIIIFIVLVNINIILVIIIIIINDYFIPLTMWIQVNLIIGIVIITKMN